MVTRVDEIDRLLALPDAQKVVALLDGPKSMARLVNANLRDFKAHVHRLREGTLARSLVNDPFGDEHLNFVEKLQHLSANYFLSAVPFLEHLKRHVDSHYPQDTHPTRVQYRLGLDGSVSTYDGHAVVVQLRHMVAHRQLPTVRLVFSPHGEQPVAPTIDRREILADDRCGKALRTLLTSLHRDELSLDGLIRDDGRLVTEFADWFFRVQALHHRTEMMPIWRLREERERLVHQVRA